MLLLGALGYVGILGACGSSDRAPYFNSGGGGEGGCAGSTCDDNDEDEVDVRELGVWQEKTDAWSTLGPSLAVDSQERVFFSTGSDVFVVDEDGPSVYLSAADLQDAAGDSEVQIRDLDVGPDDDLLYLLTAYPPYRILVAERPGDVWVHLESVFEAGGYAAPSLIGVESTDRILVLDQLSGILEVTTEDVSVLYGREGSSNYRIGTECPCEDLAVSLDREVYYLPGCASSPVLRGPTEPGGSLEVRAEAKEFATESEGDLSGVARDPEGGVVVHNERAIFHLVGETAPELVPILPTLPETAETWHYGFACQPLAKGPSGAIYVAGPDQQIYRAAWQ